MIHWIYNRVCVPLPSRGLQWGARLRAPRDPVHESAAQLGGHSPARLQLADLPSSGEFIGLLYGPAVATRSEPL